MKVLLFSIVELKLQKTTSILNDFCSFYQFWIFSIDNFEVVAFLKFSFVINEETMFFLP